MLRFISFMKCSAAKVVPILHVMDSTSSALWDTQFYFLLDQEITALPKRRMKTEIDLQSSLSPTRSEFEDPIWILS